jgi:hypothetical protein
MTVIQSEDPNEKVNHPRHYNQHPSGVECIELIEHLMCNQANAIKYVWRCGLKTTETPVRDLQSARWYTERELARCKVLGHDDVYLKYYHAIRTLALAVIEADGGTVLGQYLNAFLRGSLVEMLAVLDREIRALEGS